MSYSNLSFEQRCIIETLLNEGKYSCAMIAQKIGVNRSTVYREIRRNLGKSCKNKDVYKANVAQCKSKEKVNAKNHHIGLTEVIPMVSYETIYC